MHVKLTHSCSYKTSIQTKQQIFSNPELVNIKLRELTTVTNSFSVLGNPRLETLCASNLVEAGTVCIGNKEGDPNPNPGDSEIAGQPDLDANLKSLVTGSFSQSSGCYGAGTEPPLDADNICGPKKEIGLFSKDGCPSKACKKPKNDKTP